MSTPTIPVTSKLSNILEIINFALQALALIPALAGPIALEQAIQRILMNALAAYQAETGKPFDITNIPIETPVK